jgi:SAM-dependent methyltransferase
VSDVDVFDRPVAWRYHAVERMGLRGEDRIAGLAIGAGYPDALEPVRDAVAHLDGVVCDIGAGLGAATTWIGSGIAHMVAVEQEIRAIALAHRAFPQLPFVGAAAGALPLCSAACAGAALLGVVSLLDDVDPVLTEIARIVHPGGAVFVSDLFATGSTTLEVPTTNNRMRSLAELVDVLSRHGLRTEDVLPITRGSPGHWTDVSDAVDAEIARRHLGTPSFQRWRDDGDVLRRMLSDSLVQTVTIIATRRS